MAFAVQGILSSALLVLFIPSMGLIFDGRARELQQGSLPPTAPAWPDQNMNQFAATMWNSPAFSQQVAAEAPSMLAVSSQAVPVGAAQKIDPLQASVLSLQQEIAQTQAQQRQLTFDVAAKGYEDREEVKRLNGAAADISTNLEASLQQERETNMELANATAYRVSLQAEIERARAETKETAAKLAQAQAREISAESEAELNAKEAKRAQEAEKKALRVVDVLRATQEKVQRTEDLIRSLLPHVNAAQESAGDVLRESAGRRA